MKECLCSIFNTREERLIEEDGRIIRRLICNTCGRILDSKVENERTVSSRRNQISDEQESGAFSI